MGWCDVLAGGPETTVQDAGRPGLGHLGVARAGWLDDWAARWCHVLLENPPDAAVLEIAGGGFQARWGESGWAALTGADLGWTVDGRPWPPGSTRCITAGSVLAASGSQGMGFRSYLGVPGGFQAPVVLGSRSTDLLAGFGGLAGRRLRAGDRLAWRDPGRELGPRWAGLPTVLGSHRLRAVPDLAADLPSWGNWAILQSRSWAVAREANRVGVRLTGPRLLDTRTSGLMVSEPMAIGSIQVPPSGAPIILLKDRGTIGGYPVAGHVIQADWPRLAQMAEGDRLSVRWVNLGEADRQAAMAQRGPWCVLSEPPDPLRLRRLAPPAAGLWHPAAEEGDTLAAGDVVGFVESLGQMVPCRVPSRGRLVAVHAGSGEVVRPEDALVEWIGLSSGRDVQGPWI